MISAENRRRIFYYVNKLGLDDSTRRAIQFSVTGKESLTEINNFEADMIIKTLKSELFKIRKNIQKTAGPGRKMTAEESLKPGKHINKIPHADNVYSLITPEQIGKIKAMSLQIYGKYDELNMDRFCQRQFKKKFRRLRSDEAIKLIEIQKTMLRRKIAKEKKNDTIHTR